jgi:hypothetical protein
MHVCPCCFAPQSWCAIDEDGSRYLLSDFAGGLHLLVLAHADNRVAGIKVQTLGECSLLIGENNCMMLCMHADTG